MENVIGKNWNDKFSFFRFGNGSKSYLKEHTNDAVST